MRVKHCLADNCGSNTDNEPGLTFHSMPNNEKILKQWAVNMNKEDQFLNTPKSTLKHYFICGKHFTDSCFQTYERKKLNRGAIPTIFEGIKSENSAPKLTKANFYKNDSINPIILNHQIKFPNIFGNMEDSDRPMLPRLRETSAVIDIIDPSKDEIDDKTKLCLDLPEITRIHWKSGKDKTIEKVETQTVLPGKPADVSSIHHDSMEQILSDMFYGAKGAPRKASIKFRNATEQTRIKPSKKYIRRMLKKVKKLVLILKRSEGNCRKLFNKRVTIFNSKVIKNLEKLDEMPAVIKAYLNREINKFNKIKCVKYKKSEIPFYTALYKSNTSAYRILSNIFKIPPIQTLNDFLNNTIFESGLNQKLLTHLKQTSLLLSPLDRYCTLAFKNIQLCPYISYNNETDATEGLQIAEFEKPYVVDRCFIFFLSGLHKTWKQPIAYYFVSSQTNSLHKCIKQVISEIHDKTNFNIIASISSMKSVNINAIRNLMPAESKDFIYKINNREIIHLFDPQTLFKMLTNNFMNHDIAFDQKRTAKWDVLVELFNLDRLDGGTELRKLTSDNSNQKRNNLAAELFKSAVFISLRLTKLSRNNFDDTVDFCLFVNNLFESFNGTSLSNCEKNKLFGRLSDSSSHLEFWDEAEATLSSLVLLNKTGKALKSNPAQAFIINIRNIKKLWINLKQEGFEYLVTNNLNLESLENFHAAMRYFFGKNTKHPTSKQFQEAFKISLFNYKFWDFDSSCGNEVTFKPEIFHRNNLSPDTYLLSSAIYKLVKNVRFYSAENIFKFLVKNVLDSRCDVCVKAFCKDFTRMIAVEDLMQQINVLQREVYKNITRFLSKPHFVQKLYSFAEELWDFDFVCPQHKSEMKCKTITSICFIMVKCFIEITNKILWKQSTKK